MMIYDLWLKEATLVTLKRTDSKGGDKSDGRKTKLGGSCSGADEW